MWCTAQVRGQEDLIKMQETMIEVENPPERERERERENEKEREREREREGGRERKRETPSALALLYLSLCGLTKHLAANGVFLTRMLFVYLYTC